ncbi:MAG: electron transport complex subunit RsxB [Pseudomonadales bacterium]|nr:electron transport complex subunit RsxB [Pseudomonadales bacterium]
MLATFLPGLILLILLGLVLAIGLGAAATKYQADESEVLREVNKCLPQTQCAQCGHPGCKPYAKAILAGEPINRCPPGGDDTINKLAQLLGKPAIPLDTNFGTIEPQRLAVIRENECIGCTLCIQACPVDAIIGASQQMHSVITEQCTGCDLCLAPCPVDCIDMILLPASPDALEASNAIPSKKSTAAEISNCIRCGKCAPACPRELAPQELYWQRESTTAMAKLNLDQCVECMKCDRVCPSNIPLTAHFRTAKQNAQREQQIAVKAIEAETRHLQRTNRLETAQSRVKPRPSSKDRAALLNQLKQSASKPSKPA